MEFILSLWNSPSRYPLIILIFVIIHMEPNRSVFQKRCHNHRADFFQSDC